MRNITALIFVAPILLISCSDKPNHKMAEDRINAIVSRIKGTDAHAAEFAKARKYHYLDINDDGIKDVVSFFTIEGFGGGNNYNFYMTVLLNKKGIISELGTIKVGGKGMRKVNFDKVALNKGNLELETTEYGPDDAMCCPSKVSSARILVTGNVKEVTVAP